MSVAVGVLARRGRRPRSRSAGSPALSGPLRAGAFTGALTSTPALAAATTASGSTEPAVGYALGYPVGVTVAIVVGRASSSDAGGRRAVTPSRPPGSGSRP